MQLHTRTQRKSWLYQITYFCRNIFSDFYSCDTCFSFPCRLVLTTFNLDLPSSQGQPVLPVAVPLLTGTTLSRLSERKKRSTVLAEPTRHDCDKTHLQFLLPGSTRTCRGVSDLVLLHRCSLPSWWQWSWRDAFWAQGMLMNNAAGFNQITYLSLLSCKLARHPLLFFLYSLFSMAPKGHASPFSHKLCSISTLTNISTWNVPVK